jgi:hypothetical protein
MTFEEWRAKFGSVEPTPEAAFEAGRVEGREEVAENPTCNGDARQKALFNYKAGSMRPQSGIDERENRLSP